MGPHSLYWDCFDFYSSINRAASLLDPPQSCNIHSSILAYLHYARIPNMNRLSTKHRTTPFWVRSLLLRPYFYPFHGCSVAYAVFVLYLDTQTSYFKLVLDIAFLMLSCRVLCI